jgi:succinate dehydrogenase / fumarate reductase iron-sulfur subunit
MQTTLWHVTYQLRRQRDNGQPYTERFTLEVDPDEYVLDGIERIWAFHDRSLLFRHACHHSSCGACGMRVNGVEKLTCITRIRDITRDGGTVAVEPLRNFPLIADLAVDMGPLYSAMEQVDAQSVVGDANDSLLRLSDCIECGLCISACPVLATALHYVGPAPLAEVGQRGAAAGHVSSLVDSADGLWRCHNSFECSAVCPSGVDPAQRIMSLRRRVVGQRLKGLFVRPTEENNEPVAV